MAPSRFISSLLLTLVFCMASPVMSHAQAFLVATPPQGQLWQSRTLLAMGGHELEAITVVKADSTGEIRGAMMGQMGMTALSFSVSADRKHVKLLQIMPQLDKWYIRRQMKRMLKALFGAREDDLTTSAPDGKHPALQRDSMGRIIMTYPRRQASATLEPFKPQQP